MQYKIMVMGDYHIPVDEEGNEIFIPDVTVAEEIEAMVGDLMETKNECRTGVMG